MKSCYKHYLLYFSDREFGGKDIKGIFNSYNDAVNHYLKIKNKDNDFWIKAYIECWQDSEIIEGG